MSTSPVAIRRASPDDVRALGRLGALLVRAHHAFDPQRFIAPTPDTEDGYGDFLGTQLDDPDVLLYVATTESDGVIGYLYAGMEGPDWMSLRGPAGVLHDMVVDPAHRGRGTGRLLLETALAEFDARGAPMTVLSTAARNEAAQRLFARMGFRPTMVEMTRESE